MENIENSADRPVGCCAYQRCANIIQRNAMQASAKTTASALRTGGDSSQRRACPEDSPPPSMDESSFCCMLEGRFRIALLISALPCRSAIRMVAEFRPLVDF